jgi:Ca-activated chloride channel family protein
MGPRANASVGGPSVTGGSVDNAARVVAGMRAGFRNCYNRALPQNPEACGKIILTIGVGSDGGVQRVSTASTGSLPDTAVACVKARAQAAQFDPPQGGKATITVPITMITEDGCDDTPPPKPKPVAKPPEPTRPVVASKPPPESPPTTEIVGAVGHQKTPCAPAADLPIEERRILWRERFMAATGNVDAVTQVYWDALHGCEAPTWRERRQLLLFAVDALPTIPMRVALYRKFGRDVSASDIVYRAILTRVHTAADIRALHDALGMRQLDPAVLAKTLGEKKSPAERAALLRDLVTRWPDDIELALTLLDAYEDAGDDVSGRALARQLRRRSDAGTRVRTAVGEYYLRLAKREQGPAADRDATEARRTFGEIVEFSPDDPAARRLLGDLLRAHEWYEEALRQYETLARLTPDDTSVFLLLAASAEGLGRTEEAIRYTEKAAGGGAPDPTSSIAKTSRSFASAYLAWASDEAERAGRKDEAERLRERARRLTTVDLPEGGAVRLILTWAHPDLHPELWSSAPGALVPAADGDPLLGVSQTLLPGANAEGLVELRLEPGDAERAARLGAIAVLTAITGEGTTNEKVVRLPITFTATDGHPRPTQRFRLASGALHQEAI